MSGKRRERSRGNRRVDGRFIALPHVIIQSPGYLSLSDAARALLIEIAFQYMGENNGQLLASLAKLRTRGWNSSDKLHRAKKELLEGGFIVETVKGGRPNYASWYAVIWWPLNRHPRFDFGAEDAFKRTVPPHKRTTLSPADGVKVAPTAPKPRGLAPPDGAVESFEWAGAAPPNGHHLEMPSTGAGGTTPQLISTTHTQQKQVDGGKLGKWRPVAAEEHK